MDRHGRISKFEVKTRTKCVESSAGGKSKKAFIAFCYGSCTNACDSVSTPFTPTVVVFGSLLSKRGVSYTGQFHLLSTTHFSPGEYRGHFCSMVYAVQCSSPASPFVVLIAKALAPLLGRCASHLHVGFCQT